MEIDKSLVKWKLFKTEEEAKEFLTDKPNWSTIGHSEKGFYVGYSIAGEMAKQAVKGAGEYYKLNVPLTADYALGLNWRDCH